MTFPVAQPSPENSLQFTRLPLGIGVSFAELQGVLSGEQYRVLLWITIPQAVPVPVRFTSKPNGVAI